MLTICPTPIGNLDDVSARQHAALAGADLIVCEDTRVTGKLLELLGIERKDGVPRLMSFHDHTSEAKVEEIVERAIDSGVVLVSDAGTPSVSDPGFALVRAAIERGVEIESLPGAVAAIVGLVASGLPTDRFLFVGFLPSKSGARKQVLEEIDGPTLVIYESPNRISKTLEDVAEVFGDQREVYIGRELTKMHEEHLRGPVGQLVKQLEDRGRLKGECVLCVAPNLRRSTSVERAVSARELVRVLYEEGLSPKRIKAVGSRILGISKSDVYSHLEAVREEPGG